MLAVCLQADSFPLQIYSVKIVRQIVPANIFELRIICHLCQQGVSAAS